MMDSSSLPSASLRNFTRIPLKEFSVLSSWFLRVVSPGKMVRAPFKVLKELI